MDMGGEAPSARGTRWAGAGWGTGVVRWCGGLGRAWVGRGMAARWASCDGGDGPEGRRRQASCYRATVQVVPV